MSLTINKNSNNTICVTLKEKSVLENPIYLFQFKNVASGAFSYCVVTETSTQLDRYNRFIIIEKSNPNPLAGEVSLETRDYEYTAFEQQGSTNLNPIGLNPVESGYAVVLDGTAVQTKEYNGGSITNKVYNG